MKMTVKKWGNSAAIRIPATLMKAAHLNMDEAITIHEENGRLIIEPIRPNSYRLAQLIAGITEDNLHTEVDFGAATGKEAL